LIGGRVHSLADQLTALRRRCGCRADVNFLPQENRCAAPEISDTQLLEQLRNRLKTRLPRYMIPADWYCSTGCRLLPTERSIVRHSFLHPKQ